MLGEDFGLGLGDLPVLIRIASLYCVIESAVRSADDVLVVFEHHRNLELARLFVLRALVWNVAQSFVEDPCSRFVLEFDFSSFHILRDRFSVTDAAGE